MADVKLPKVFFSSIQKERSIFFYYYYYLHIMQLKIKIFYQFTDNLCLILNISITCTLIDYIKINA